MQFVILKVLQGPEVGRKMTVRAGQRVHVGRSPRADFCLVRDPSLADYHFVLDCTRGLCDFQLVQGCPPGEFGDQALISETLYDGDRFQIGASTFHVEIVGQTVSRPMVAPDSVSSPAGNGLPSEAEADSPEEPSRSGFAKVKYDTAAMVLERIPDPPDELVELHKEGEIPRELFEKLVASGEMVLALQFLTHALPKREAVWALVSAIQTFSGAELSPKEQAALKVALQWVTDPTEEHRRQAEIHANLLKQKTPTGLAVQAAFWSEGSMGPAGGAEIPVLEPLCANMVNSGVIKLAFLQDDSADALQQLAQHWIAVADGKLSW